MFKSKKTELLKEIEELKKELTNIRNYEKGKNRRRLQCI